MTSLDRLPNAMAVAKTTCTSWLACTGVPNEEDCAIHLALICCIALDPAMQCRPSFRTPAPFRRRAPGTRRIPPPSCGGGDNFATATIIPGIPYADGGSTRGATNDYNPSCLVFDRAGRRVSLHARDQHVRGRFAVRLVVRYRALDLRRHDRDRRGPARTISPDCGLQSHLQGVALTGGPQLFHRDRRIQRGLRSVHDEHYGARRPPVCDPCPAAAVLEGEPACSDGYIDTFNGGCNSTCRCLTLPCNPNLYVCGTYGTFNANGTRDTDWYQFTHRARRRLRSASTAWVSPDRRSRSSTTITCPPNVICGSFNPSSQCATNTRNAVLGAGTYRIFTASFFGPARPATRPTRCTSAEWPVRPTPRPLSWGKLKDHLSLDRSPHQRHGHPRGGWPRWSEVGGRV